MDKALISVDCLPYRSVFREEKKISFFILKKLEDHFQHARFFLETKSRA